MSKNKLQRYFEQIEAWEQNAPPALTRKVKDWVFIPTKDEILIANPNPQWVMNTAREEQRFSINIPHDIALELAIFIFDILKVENDD